MRLRLRLRLLCVIVLQSDCLRQFDGETRLLEQLHFCRSQTADANFEIVERSKCAIAVTFGWTATETDRELRVSAVPATAPTLTAACPAHARLLPHSPTILSASLLVLGSAA